jgi:sulfur carrier protein ThiS
VRILAEMFSQRSERDVDLGADATGMDLLRSLGLSPDAHLLVRGDDPIPADEPLVDGERILILSVVSGGAPI